MSSREIKGKAPCEVWVLRGDEHSDAYNTWELWWGHKRSPDGHPLAEGVVLWKCDWTLDWWGKWY